jgi:hypothetical protein
VLRTDRSPALPSIMRTTRKQKTNNYFPPPSLHVSPEDKKDPLKLEIILKFSVLE